MTGPSSNWCLFINRRRSSINLGSVSLECFSYRIAIIHVYVSLLKRWSVTTDLAVKYFRPYLSLSSVTSIESTSSSPSHVRFHQWAGAEAIVVRTSAPTVELVETIQKKKTIVLKFPTRYIGVQRGAKQITLSDHRQFWPGLRATTIRTSCLILQQFASSRKRTA